MLSIDNTPRCLVQDIGNSQGERRDHRVKPLVLGDHLIRPVHRPYWRMEGAGAGVLKGLTRAQDGLLTDDTRALNLLDLSIPVSDDPVAADELHILITHVADVDAIGEEIIVALWCASLRDEDALDLNTDPLCGLITHTHTLLTERSGSSPLQTRV